MNGLSLLFLLCPLLTLIESHEELETTLDYDEKLFEENVPSKPHFIMFFAPWCGHCKNLAPTWGSLAEKYNKKDSVVIAKVDCTLHTPLCSSQEVTGYPTLKFFGKGIENSLKYRGNRDFVSLDKFVHEQLGIDYQGTGDNEEKKELIEFTEETFEKINDGSYFVKFYAPWCGHCQRLAPVWASLAKSFENSKEVTIGQVDCTQLGQICKDFEVKGYPTLLWIKDGKKIEKYSGDRSIDYLKQFVVNRLEEGSKTATKVENKNPVLMLTSDGFDDVIKSGITLVKYFAPWCGHCKRLAPIYEELSRKFIDHSLVKIAQVDCTDQLSSELCSKEQINGFPTLFLYRDGKKVTEYDGDRSLEDMSSFITEHLGHDEL